MVKRPVQVSQGPVRPLLVSFMSCTLVFNILTTCMFFSFDLKHFYLRPSSSTALIVYKIWSVHRELRSILQQSAGAAHQWNRSSSSKYAMRIVIESGIVYWLIWVMYLPLNRTTAALTEVITRQTLVLVSQLIGDTAFSNGMVYFTEGCLITLVVSPKP